MRKILNLEKLSSIIDKKRRKKEKIVLSHGVFDILHIGHIKHFQAAKKLGDVLIVSLTKDQSFKIVNQLLKDDMSNFINNELFDNYITPGKLFKIIKLSEEYNMDLVNFDLSTTLKTIIRDKIYKKDKTICELIYSFIELYFRNNISSENISLLNSYHFFLEKINNTKIYNLDEETLFMEFEDKILNG